MRNTCTVATSVKNAIPLGTILFLAAMLCWSSVHAAREFPETAIRGTVTSHQYPQYIIDSTELRIAAGGRIFDQNNLIIMPASLAPGPAEVMYRLDINGQLSAIWLLTREEAALHPKPGKSSSAGDSGRR